MTASIPDTDKPKGGNVFVRCLLLAAVILFGIAWSWWVAWHDDKTPAPTKTASSRPDQPSAPPPEPPFTLPPAPPVPFVGVRIGNMAQEIQGEDVDGQPFKLSDFRGKVVLLDFWGDW